VQLGCVPQEIKALPSPSAAQPARACACLQVNLKTRRGEHAAVLHAARMKNKSYLLQAPQSRRVHVPAHVNSETRGGSMQLTPTCALNAQYIRLFKALFLNNTSTPCRDVSRRDNSRRQEAVWRQRELGATSLSLPTRSRTCGVWFACLPCATRSGATTSQRCCTHGAASHMRVTISAICKHQFAE
jgi:hypothetical protein